MVETRKIQLIANSTYTISLPKKWIEKNKLKEKDTLEIEEMPDGSLTIIKGKNKLNFLEIEISADYEEENLGEILLALYYLGTETIKVYSKTALTKNTKAKIMKTLQIMSGTVISYEDEKQIKISILLDKTKVELNQILYRIFTILDNSLTAIQDKINKEEIQINENEIDKLYHLGVKMLSISLTDSKLLNTSGIKYTTLIPSYFFILKRLEHIGDEIQNSCKETNYKIEKSKEIVEAIQVIRKKLSEIVRQIKKEKEENKNNNAYEFQQIENNISKIDQPIQNHIMQIIRFIRDMQEEVAYLKYYKKLIEEKNENQIKEKTKSIA